MHKIFLLILLMICMGTSTQVGAQETSTQTLQKSEDVVAAVDVNTLHYEEYPTIRLRSLDKITARTLTFDAQVGTIIKFGDIFIKILSCRKPPPVEKTESAAFLQIWEVDKVKDQSRWIFSGWMFASSPALSGMDHPVYDVWVIDCLGKDPEESPPIDTSSDQALPDEGEVGADQVQEPEGQPQSQESAEETRVPTAEEDNPFTGVIESLTTEAPAPAPDPHPEPEPEPETNPEPDNSFNGIY